MNRRTMIRKTAGALLATGTVLSTGSAAAEDDEQCDDEPMTTGGQVAGACDDETDDQRGYIPGSPDDPSYESDEPEETHKTTGGEVA